MKKRSYLIILGIVLVIVIGFVIGNSKKIDWSSLVLGQYLPEPTKSGDVGSNLDDYLSVTIDDSNGKYFEKYVKACIDKGYTIDSEKTVTSFEAFNKDGYELKIYKTSDDFSIHLTAPEKMSEIEWPTKGIGAMLPIPKSNLGKVTSDTSKTFRVVIGNTTIDEYNNYIKECENKGFDIDYYKNEKSYEAKNSDGYRLNVSYQGANTINIMIQTPKEENNTTEDKETNVDKEENTEQNSNSSGISTNFKKAMDEYEKFMDEYIAFMKKYANSNGTDTELLKDYSNYMTKYLEMVESFEKWEDKELNTKETKYYIQVQSRVNQKLIDASLN